VKRGRGRPKKEEVEDSEDEDSEDEESEDEESEDEESEEDDSEDEESEDEESEEDDSEDEESEEIDFDKMKANDLKEWIKSQVDPTSDKAFLTEWIAVDLQKMYKSADQKKKLIALRTTARRIIGLQEKWEKANKSADFALKIAEKAGADVALGRGRKSDDLRRDRYAARAVIAGYGMKT